MRREESSIYISLKRLRKLLRNALFNMNKTDRHFYGAEIITSMNKTFMHFVLAFEYKDEREKHMRGMIAWFAVLCETLEFVASEGLLHFRARSAKPEKGKPRNPVDEIPTGKMEIFKLIASIDKDISRWAKSQKRAERTIAEG